MGKEGGIIEHFRSPDFVQYYIVSLYISSNIFIIHVSCVRQSFLADLLVIDVPLQLWAYQISAENKTLTHILKRKEKKILPIIFLHYVWMSLDRLIIS